MLEQNQYTEDNIRSLDWKEHIRMRPGMYIGKLGDGSSPDDGIYILLKEVLDNSIDEFVMGTGKTIEVTVRDKTVTVRDYGRGIPLGKVVDVVSKMNTGGKYDSKAFKKSSKNLNSDYFVDIIHSSDNLGSKTDAIGIKKFVDKLAEKCVKIIELLYFKGYTQKEASEELDMPIGTIKTRNRNYIYITEKYKIKCERKFEINPKNMVIGFSSRNCF